ncbi:MAG: hypothetical protein K2Z81_20155 [Cyanobacteria bacterium]|nr:hypothetical protein [Cyanobacteriota bacterium]
MNSSVKSAIGCLLLSWHAQSAFAATFPEADAHAAMTDSLVAGKQWTDGKGFIETSVGISSKLDAYQFNSEMKAFVKQIKHSQAKITFKKESRIRIEVLSGSVHKGAIVVRRKDGTVKGIGGGYLRFLSMNLEPNSTILKMPTGHNVLETDFGSLMRDVRKRVNGGETASVTTSSISGPEWKNPVKVIDVKLNATQKSSRIFIDCVTNLPVAWDTYKDGKLIAFVKFTDLKLHADVADELFEL